MIVRFDFWVALGLAAGLHVAGFGLYATYGGVEGAGAEGRASLTLQAASGDMTALVADWNRAPDAGADVAEMNAPASEPDVKIDVWTDRSVVNSAPKFANAPERLHAPEISTQSAVQVALFDTPIAPTAPVPGFEAPVRAAEPTALRTLHSDAIPAAMSPPDPSARAVAVSERPLKRPAPKAPAPPLVARGSGAGVGAGTLSEARVVASVAPAARAAAQATWAASIQRQIARQQTYPRSERGTGRVRLAMDILADGRLQAVRVDRSSGKKAFDQAALRAAKSAAPFPPAPDE